MNHEVQVRDYVTHKIVAPGKYRVDRTVVEVFSTSTPSGSEADRRVDRTLTTHYVQPTS